MMQKNDIKIALNKFDSICRICLEEKAELDSIWGIIVETEKRSEHVDLVAIIKRYCGVEVKTTDDKPQQMCKPCIKLLCDSYAFFEKCSQSNQILDDILSENKWKLEEKIEQPSQEVSNDKIKTSRTRISKRVQDSYFSESDNEGCENNHEDDSDWEPSNNDVKPDLSIKEEEEVLLVLEIEGEENDGAELGLDPVKPQRRKRKAQELAHSNKRRGRPKKNQVSSNKNDTEDSEAIANQHKELMCRICGEILPDINTSIDHYDEFHAPKMELDQCILCDKPKIYKKRDNLLYHMALHSIDSIKCVPCRKYFRTKEFLSEHLNECLKVSETKVEDSRNKSNNTQLSQRELKLLQRDGSFTCQICNQHLGEIDEVISHFEEYHLDDLRCILCLATFTKQVPLFHLGLHSKESYVCKPCRLFFKTKGEYDDHYTKYDHDKSLSCKICGKEFTRNYKKNKHMLSHLKEKNYACNKCGKTFTYRTSLVRHFKMHFGKRFLCSSCGNAYTTKYMLQRHIRVAHTHVDEDGKPLPKPSPKPVKLQCEFCGEIFTTKYGYGRHIRRHPEFKEFKCKICTFICDTRDQLNVHMENKHNKHTCDVCGKRFPFESELKTHHRKHEDIETARFRCDICGKTARTQTQLKVHYRIHTGERPFSCDICNKSFKQTAHLKVHMFQHTGKMPFKCGICEKTFPFQHVMEIHMRTHTGEKPFHCAICGNAYHDRTTLQKHQKKKHPEIPVEKVSRSEYKFSVLS